MKKLTKLKICNRSLLLATFAVLISGIELEVIHSNGSLSVWIHIILGLLFMCLVGIHIYLHFGKSNWFARFSKLRSQATRILWWLTLITLITGIATTVRWIVTNTHSPLGGIHGKLGFLMIILSIFHIAKRFKFFRPHST
ncbi:MAG: DUF4405 domain-containing protein [Bacteroidales bacterium]|nr:DUF4405 domain-containing protein [Bacteroidales bacterium]